MKTMSYVSILVACFILSLSSVSHAERAMASLRNDYREVYMKLAKRAVSLDQFRAEAGTIKGLGYEFNPALDAFMEKHHPLNIGDSIMYKGTFGKTYYGTVIKIKVIDNRESYDFNRKQYRVQFNDGLEEDHFRDEIYKSIQSFRDIQVNNTILDRSGYFGRVAAIYDNGDFMIAYKGYENKWYIRQFKDLIPGNYE